MKIQRPLAVGGHRSLGMGRYGGNESVGEQAIEIGIV